MEQQLSTLAIVIGIWFGLLLVLERMLPLRKVVRPVVPRLIANFVLGVIALLTAAITVKPVVSKMLSLTESNHFGILALIELPSVLSTLLAILLLDLSFYYWHRLNHRIPLLWRMHVVHHIDPDMDVSTSFRFHFGEIVLSVVFRIVQLGLLGVSGTVFVIYEALFQAITLLQHSNLRLPFGLERVMVRLLVTPRMHSIHHSHVALENNANFGILFTCWDRVHRTLKLNVPSAEVVVGIPGYLQPSDNQLINALTMPFKKQRLYWIADNGTEVTRKSAETSLTELLA